jgi:biopolymer transport protein TolR
MLKRPSSRRRHPPQEVQINLVPMLDALVTMIAFLMFTMAFLSLNMIESPLPAQSESKEQKADEPTLQLTVSVNEGEVMVWSPFNRIKSVTIPNLDGGKGRVNAVQLHDELVRIKREFPKENHLVVMPKANVSYETLVEVMDAARNVEKTDGVISVPNASGVPEQVDILFKNVVFGNIIGG